MIRVLLIEDNPDDALRIQRALTGSGDGVYLDSFEFVTADSLSRGMQALKSGKMDVVLLDLGLPDTREFEGVDRLKDGFPLIPIVVLTKQREDTLVAVEAVKRGAQDYFSKGNLSDTFDLDRIIRYAIERKKNEEELIRAREQALDASKAKSEFLSSMSHDIRTPLNCIIGVADLLLSAKLPEAEANYVRMLNKASDNLLSLINDCLDLSKIESGLIKIAKVTFDLLEKVEGVLDFTSARAHAKGLEIIFRIGPDVPRKLVGDPGHVGQILVNLLGNAIKFTKSGEVTLSISRVDSQGAGATLRFAVKDTGFGIPEDKLSAIFESFTQLEQKDASLKRQGSGLGLSICKRLVELMNGRIDVQSEIGKGSTFQFELPFELPQRESSQVVNAPLSLKNIEMLVTDDNVAHGVILEELLTHWGATVHVTRNAQEAVDLTEKMRSCHKKFDIALLDLRMPGIATGGVELAQRLKDDIKTVILMLPTNHRYGDIERLKHAGIANYYFKPTKPEQLAEMISGILCKNPKNPLVSQNIDMNPFPKTLNLLVADDSEENRQLIDAYCKGTGFTLELAEDGRQAFEKFKKQNFDLVLMDIQMPEMNGYEALLAIRAWEETQKRPEVPVLALTAFALKEEAERCLSAGFKAHLTKPIRKTDLLKTIKKYAA